MSNVNFGFNISLNNNNVDKKNNQEADGHLKPKPITDLTRVPVSSTKWHDRERVNQAASKAFKTLGVVSGTVGGTLLLAGFLTSALPLAAVFIGSLTVTATTCAFIGAASLLKNKKCWNDQEYVDKISREIEQKSFSEITDQYDAKRLKSGHIISKEFLTEKFRKEIKEQTLSYLAILTKYDASLKKDQLIDMKELLPVLKQEVESEKLDITAFKAKYGNQPVDDSVITRFDDWYKDLVTQGIKGMDFFEIRKNFPSEIYWGVIPKETMENAALSEIQGKGLSFDEILKKFSWNAFATNLISGEIADVRNAFIEYTGDNGFSTGFKNCQELISKYKLLSDEACRFIAGLNEKKQQAENAYAAKKSEHKKTLDLAITSAANEREKAIFPFSKALNQCKFDISKAECAYKIALIKEQGLLLNLERELKEVENAAWVAKHALYNEPLARHDRLSCDFITTIDSFASSAIGMPSTPINTLVLRKEPSLDRSFTAVSENYFRNRIRQTKEKIAAIKFDYAIKFDALKAFESSANERYLQEMTIADAQYSAAVSHAKEVRALKDEEALPYLSAALEDLNNEYATYYYTNLKTFSAPQNEVSSKEDVVEQEIIKKPFVKENLFDDIEDINQKIQMATRVYADNKYAIEKELDDLEDTLLVLSLSVEKGEHSESMAELKKKKEELLASFNRFEQENDENMLSLTKQKASLKLSREAFPEMAVAV